MEWAPSMDSVSVTIAVSCGHGLVLGSQMCSPGKAAHEKGCTGLTVTAQVPAHCESTKLPGGGIAPDTSPSCISSRHKSPFHSTKGRLMTDLVPNRAGVIVPVHVRYAGKRWFEWRIARHRDHGLEQQEYTRRLMKFQVRL